MRLTNITPREAICGSASGCSIDLMFTSSRAERGIGVGIGVTIGAEDAGVMKCKKPHALSTNRSCNCTTSISVVHRKCTGHGSLCVLFLAYWYVPISSTL